jgi:hypothetical protein
VNSWISLLRQRYYLSVGILLEHIPYFGILLPFFLLCLITDLVLVIDIFQGYFENGIECCRLEVILQHLFIDEHKNNFRRQTIQIISDFLVKQPPFRVVESTSLNDCLPTFVLSDYLSIDHIQQT